MALRISSAEIVSSAMALSPLPCGSCLVVWSGAWSASRGSADEPSAGDFQSMGDAAVDDLVADLDDQAAQDARVHGHLQTDRPAVDPAQHLGQPLLLLRRERDGG